MIQDQSGDPVAVLSGAMGVGSSGQPTQAMGIAWRGVFCNTGGVIFADRHDSDMPALRIGHKGLHVERLDGLPYVFNRQYFAERLQQGTGRTSAEQIASGKGWRSLTIAPQAASQAFAIDRRIKPDSWLCIRSESCKALQSLLRVSRYSSDCVACDCKYQSTTGVQPRTSTAIYLGHCNQNPTAISHHPFSIHSR